MDIASLPTPALLLDLDRLEANLERMAARARRLGVTLRPHVKTHKCTEVAGRQRALGARGVTVSTLYEAQVFAEYGFDDITWAFPIVLSRLDEAKALAERVRLGVVVDTAEAVEALEHSRHPFRVWLKVDSGYHRAGVDPRTDTAVDLAHRLAASPPLTFEGILTHSGHAYHGRSRGEVLAAAQQERQVMVDFAARLRATGVAVPCVSVGSTPAMSVVDRLDGVNEARPGNYVFYDYMQCVIGSCTPADCAVTVLSSVVSSQPGAAHSVIDAGALALSKDPGSELAPHQSMGEIYADYPAGRLDANVRVVGLSQEHGRVNRRLPAGSRLRVLPNHSCLTAAHFDEYHVTRGDEVVDRWKIWRGR